MRKIILPLVLLALLGGRAHQASAQIEVEVDPIAYGLNGFSLHIANVMESVRVSVGTFGIDVPEWLHGNDGWNAAMRGGGMKLDYLGSGIDGFFLGVDGGYMRMTYGAGGGSEVKRSEWVSGARTGYRIPVGGRGLYVSPWVGVSYTFGGGDVVIGDDRFDHRPIAVFPTIHIGWRF
jgi:hypothetical protein